MVKVNDTKMAYGIICSNTSKRIDFPAWRCSAAINLNIYLPIISYDFFHQIPFPSNLVNGPQHLPFLIVLHAHSSQPALIGRIQFKLKQNSRSLLPSLYCVLLCAFTISLPV